MKGAYTKRQLFEIRNYMTFPVKHDGVRGDSLKKKVQIQLEECY